MDRVEEFQTALARLVPIPILSMSEGAKKGMSLRQDFERKVR